MEWNKFRKGFIDFLAKLFIVIFVLCLVFGGVKTCSNSFKKDEEVSTPVERYEIDSISKENNKLIIEVESLDSIKNAKVIEVKSLDNDSTLRLFYELIRK